MRRVPKETVQARLPALLAYRIDQALSPTGFTSRSQLIHWAMAHYMAEEYGHDLEELLEGIQWRPRTLVT